MGEIRAICGLKIFPFPSKIVLTPSARGRQDRSAPSCLGVSPRAPPDPLSAGQPVSEWFARTTKTTPMKIYLKKSVLGQVTLIFALACFALSPQARAVCQEGCLENNTVLGDDAFVNNTTGDNDTAIGSSALTSNTTGFFNTAIGDSALINNTTGNNNIALGKSAGLRLTTGSNNIEIGNLGVAGEANTTRIGTSGTQTRTFIAGIS